MTTEPSTDDGARHPPIRPGEILAEEFMTGFGLSERQLAGRLGVPVETVREVVEGRKAISLALSQKLGQMFGQSDAFWLNMQTHYERRVDAFPVDGRA